MFQAASLPITATIRRISRPRFARIPLYVERCEERLAAGQLFSMLGDPVESFLSPSETMTAATREADGSFGRQPCNPWAATPSLEIRQHSAQIMLVTAETEEGEADSSVGEVAAWLEDLTNALASPLESPPFADLAPPTPAGIGWSSAASPAETARFGGGGEHEFVEPASLASLDTPAPLPRAEALGLAQLAGAAIPEESIDAAMQSREATLRGTLEVLCAHEEDEPGYKEYYLHTAGQQIRLWGAESLADYQSGTELTVRGLLGPQGLNTTADAIVVHSTPDEGGEDDEGISVQAVRRVLVLNVNFNDRVQQPWSITTARNLFNTNISNWFSQGSYGQVTIAADVLGWYTLNTTSTTCNSGNWATLAQNRARQAGYNPDNYQHVVIAFPRVPACGWAGLGQVPGKLTWLNNAMNLSVAVHELGHNLGLAHSKSQRCSTGPLTGSCTTTEYGDRYDTMGSGGQAHFHASYRAHLGWIPSGSRRTLTPSVGSATVALVPASSSTGTRLLRVQRRGRSDYLHVEVRNSSGYDSVLSQYGNLMNGVAIYVGTSLRDQKVVDFTYNTSSAGDAAVRLGNTLYDYVGDVAIVSWYRSSGQTVVYVQYGFR